MKDCVSLEIAKKLKEAGWGINGFFVWKIGKATGVENLRISYEAGDDTEHFDFFFAPTIGELLEALPDSVKDGTEYYWLELSKVNDAYFANFYSNEKLGAVCPLYPDNNGRGNKNPADALALLFIELKKKGLV